VVSYASQSPVFLFNRRGRGRCRRRHYLTLYADLEFFTGARRHGSNIQETFENVLTATIVLTSTLVVLEVNSVT